MTTARLVAAGDAARRYRLIRLARPDPAAQEASERLYTRPGQYLMVAPPGGAGNPYAIASPPGERGGFDVLIKREEGVADALAALEPGARVDMGEPSGRGYEVDAARGCDVVLLAAGSAIAPIHALLAVLCRRRADFGAITLYYGQEQNWHFALLDRLERLAAASAVRVVPVVSGPEPQWSGARGWVQDAAARDAAGWDPAGTVVYVCGMPAMEAAVRELAAARGIPADRVLTNL